MALAIVRHAVTHDLVSIGVRESDRSREAPEFWQLVPDWGPSIFYAETPSTGADWFARGLVELFLGDRPALTSLTTAAATDVVQPKRWITHLETGKRRHDSRIELLDPVDDLERAAHLSTRRRSRAYKQPGTVDASSNFTTGTSTR